MRFSSCLLVITTALAIRNNPFFKQHVKTSSVIGSWRLISTGDSKLTNQKATLEIVPLLHCVNAEQCRIKFDIQRHLFLSTSLSNSVSGITDFITKDTMTIKWTMKKYAELIVLGIGISLTPVDIVTARPKGSIRTISYQSISPMIMKVIYEDQIYLFERLAKNDKTSAALTLEVWLFFQVISAMYVHFVHVA